VDSKSWVWSA